MASSLYFYTTRDYTALAKFDVIFFLLAGLVMKPLVREDMMQWVFNFLTAVNVYAAIVVLSYFLSDSMPYPPQSNILLRLLLYIGVIFIFRRFLRPLYREVVGRWNISFMVVVCVFFNFAYYFVSSGDIEGTLDKDAAPLLLLILLSGSAYLSILYALKSLAAEYELLEENMRAEACQQLLESELASYRESEERSRRNRHDVHHHNRLIGEYLSQGDTDGTKSYLVQYDKSIDDDAIRQYCENQVANAVFSIFERRAAAAHIDYTISSNIPEKFPLSAPDLGVMLSNMMKNACESCESSAQPHINFLAGKRYGYLAIELSNSAPQTVRFDEDGMPVSSKLGGGIGTRNIAEIADKHVGIIKNHKIKSNGGVLFVGFSVTLVNKDVCESDVAAKKQGGFCSGVPFLLAFQSVHTVVHEGFF